METAFSDVFAVGSEFIKRLAYASDVEIADGFGDLGNTVTIVTNDAKIYIPLGDLVDFEAEAKRLQKELAAAEEKLAFINKKLDNPGFVNKAPEKVVQQNRDEAAKLTEKIANLRSSWKIWASKMTYEAAIQLIKQKQSLGVQPGFPACWRLWKRPAVCKTNCR